MIKNYFLVAFRNLRRNKLRTLVHILGLSIGIAVCLLVFHIVSFETDFDKFHKDGDRIYQVNTETFYNEESWKNGGVPFPLGDVIMDEIPEIEAKTHFYTLWDVKIAAPGENKIHKGGANIVFANNQFFHIFPREWLVGNPATVLTDLNQVVLTESKAKTYFPEMSPAEVLGKEMVYYFMDTVHTTVVGIVADYKENSDLKFTDLISMGNMLVEENRDDYAVDQWNSVNSSSQVFVRLNPNAKIADVDAKFKGIVDKYMEKERGNATVFSLMPLSEIHFHENFDQSGANKSVLQGLVIIGFFILLLASMNFINLETAQSIIRSKEVGIRKTLGSSRSQLVFQFLSETALIVTLSIFVAVFLSEMLVKYFRDFIPEGLAMDYLSQRNILFLTVLAFVLTLVSGLFPALILSGYQPHKVLKRDLKTPNGFSLGHFIQKNLTVFQFALSIGFIISVLVVSSQIKYMVTKDMGFDKEQVLYIRTPYLVPESQKEAFKTDIDNQSFVLKSTLGNDIMASSSMWTSLIEIEREGEKKEIGIQVKNIDENYLGVYKVDLIFGRNIRNVETEMLINQTLAKTIEFANPSDAIGQQISYSDREFTVVGIVPDFHTRSLREKILPLIMVYRPINSHTLSLRMEASTDLMAAKGKLDAISKKFFPVEEEEFKFFDETLAGFYKSDLKLRKVLGMATMMALIISLLGLFALSSFTISQRTKEISIRKVLGATLRQILYLISLNYMVLIGIAFVLAVFPAYYFLNDWLNGFEYRVDMPYLIFLLAGLGVLTICLVIVGIHSWIASQTNPAKILKSE
ncbi:ABC transporter permease [Rhodonellum sp.]|uniref:ABC transporter permease n=1 Tax=Rhodonellum sp. TaxID=2231180 RepID=UPI00271C29EB|nr:ABC transporter permease [Rhodonellum sp.]MDO9554114.1 ABC transporter permease [Rhodonellum sp.]